MNKIINITNTLSCFFSLRVFVMLSLLSCHSKKTLFKKISSDISGVHFNNQIRESDSLNPLDQPLMYNGAGLGIGDFNNDGLSDIFFAGNQVDNKLYLNNTHFSFTDITAESGVQGEGRWCGGVSIVDVNSDGWQDIYVSCSSSHYSGGRKNLLYVNQHINKQGIPIFKEQALEYGLADTGFSVQAVFFDYDNDGDMDMYLVQTSQPNAFTNNFRSIIKDGSAINNDQLFKNEWDNSLNHPFFTNVSKQAGILWEGFGLGVAITDINKDGWKDIYVTNDFFTCDELYINNHDGTFSNKINDYFKHTSLNAMGNDVADINNDALPDILTVDMNPEDNYRKKMNLNPENIENYENMLRYGYEQQYIRNTLQLNQGSRTGNDRSAFPIFSEIGFYAGIAETDWSWSVLAADFDNDGFRDIAITNGYGRDITDHDFITYLYNDKKNNNNTPRHVIMNEVPKIKLVNYLYKNNGDLTFSNKSKEWGFDVSSFSNGAAYADLDNDGDLDYVVSNINDEAFLYENTNLQAGYTNYIRIKAKGNNKNPDAIGAVVQVYYDGNTQWSECSPYRGYLSTTENIAHFGIGKANKVDSIIVTFCYGSVVKLFDVAANQLIVADENLRIHEKDSTGSAKVHSLLKEVGKSINLDFLHKENPCNDFNLQWLLPHQLSQSGPVLAVGDINGDTIDDIFIGGSAGSFGKVAIQNVDGTFLVRPFQKDANDTSKYEDDTGAVLFDADTDGDADLFVTSGGFRYPYHSPYYQDRLYINDGKGKFTLTVNSLPSLLIPKSCVKTIDYDKDGDLDLFVGGRCNSPYYPMPVSSFILRNDCKAGKILFTDVGDEVAPGLKNFGLITDASISDVDNDGWQDIITTGEWMPVSYFKNSKGVFENVTASSGLQNFSGWWNTIVSVDIDKDGDMDFIAGNLGLNSFYRASTQYPLQVYAKDFDNTNSLNFLISQFFYAAKNEDGTYAQKNEFPSHTRDDILFQRPILRKRYNEYRQFAKASTLDILTEDDLENCYKSIANYMASALIKNEGGGKFSIVALPAQAQFSSINGIICDDINEDSNVDILLSGNNYGTQRSIGNYDAMNGLALIGDGAGNFASLSVAESGLYIPYDGRSLVKVHSIGRKSLYLAAQNNERLLVFEKDK